MIAQIAAAKAALEFGSLTAAAKHFFSDPSQTSLPYPSLKTFSDDWKKLSDSDKMEIHEGLIKNGYCIGKIEGTTNSPITAESAPSAPIALPPPKVDALSIPPIVKDDESIHAAAGYSVGDEHPAVKAA